MFDRPHPWPAFVTSAPLRPMHAHGALSLSQSECPSPMYRRLWYPGVRRCQPVVASTTSADGGGGHGHQIPPNNRSLSSDKLNVKAEKKQRMSVQGLIFLFVTYVWSIILFVPMLIAHPFVLWRDRARRRFHDFIAMAWMRWSLATVRVRPHVMNEQNVPAPGVAVVYVANHTSYLDIYTFAYLFRRIKYVSKAEIFSIPIVGWAMRMAGNVALRRMNRRGQIEAYRKMVDVIKNGLSLVVFPEGTRSATGKMRRFQAGAFRAAKQNDAMVIPVTILGTKECMPSHAWVPLRYPHEPIKLVIHPALDSRKYSINELRDLSYEAINSALPPDAQSSTVPKHV